MINNHDNPEERAWEQEAYQKAFKDQWYWGDWWNKGEAYKTRVEVVKHPDFPGPAHQTLRHLGMAAAAFDVFRRRNSLSVSLYLEVMGLPEEKQEYFLDLAEDFGLGQKDLRERVKEWKKEQEENEPKQEEKKPKLDFSKKEDEEKPSKDSPKKSDDGGKKITYNPEEHRMGTVALQLCGVELDLKVYWKARELDGDKKNFAKELKEGFEEYFGDPKMRKGFKLAKIDWILNLTENLLLLEDDLKAMRQEIEND